MDEFICAHFGRLIWLGQYSGTRLSDNLPTYTAVSTISFLRSEAVILLRMCIEWTNSFVHNLFAPAPFPSEFAWDAFRGNEI